MTFQAYLDNIQQKTGKTPDELHELAKNRGMLRGDIKAMEFVGWIKEEFELGHGHAMAVLELFKRRNWISLPAGRGKQKS